MSSECADLANKLLSMGRPASAVELIRKELRHRPLCWRSRFQHSGKEYYFAWRADEFDAYTAFRRSEFSDTNVLWAARSYSHLYFLLGFAHVDLGQFKAAVYSLEHGLALEPDNPELLVEKAQVLIRTGMFRQALYLAERAEVSRTWNLPRQRAAALRCQSYCLIERGYLDEARVRLRRSLVFEPNNKNALSELEYLDSIDTREVRPCSDPAEAVQYAILELENDRYIERDAVQRFYGVRAALDRLAQVLAELGVKPPFAIVTRTDRIDSFIGKNFDQTPQFGGKTLDAFMTDIGGPDWEDRLFGTNEPKE